MPDRRAPDGPADDTPAVEERRERLARAQHDLLAALVAAGPRPDGFDEGRLRVQAAGLIAKRRGLVARSAPDLVARLGPRFTTLFAEYAGGRPRPPGGSRADALAFAAWLGLPPAPEAPRPGLLGRLLRRRTG
ncbi:hypothetical protein [Nonomuraea indica]|uniref:SCO6045-like C-terminal domain-containing protein n=1 Tax=Nonomuraea indica TaxID=1581193 RepID=A0ABW8AB64_9ACTN